MRERMAARSRRTLCTADKLAAGVWRFNHSCPSPLPRALAVQAFTSPIFTGCMPPDQRSGLQCLINTGISPIIRATASTSKMEIPVNRGRAGLSAVSSQPSACSYALRAESWESDLREFGLDCAQRRWHPTVLKGKGSRPVSGAVDTRLDGSLLRRGRSSRSAFPVAERSRHIRPGRHSRRPGPGATVCSCDKIRCSSKSPSVSGCTQRTA